jgi:Family of unknown function (DUF5678)
MATRKPRKTTPTDPLNGEWEIFDRRLKTLLPRYEGQFVAMRNGRVVDHDRDDAALALRMFDKYGDKPFIIGEVTQEPRVYGI